MCRRIFKSVVKSHGSTMDCQRILGILSSVEEIGIPSVAVKCVDIRKNAKGEGRFLGRY